MIDAVTPDNPVFINRLDGHMALANSLAMRLAKIDRTTKDVEGGEIVRDAEGNPTGIFKDTAMGYIERIIPDPTFEEKLEYAQAMSDYAASLGVTSVQDMSAGTDVGVYQELLRRGTLKTRIYACSPLADYERWKRTGIHFAFGGAMLRVGCLKGFTDGSLHLQPPGFSSHIWMHRIPPACRVPMLRQQWRATSSKPTRQNFR